MAYSKVPTDWIPDWSEDATDITVPLASFPEMTAAEADAASGDIANILYAIAEKIATVWLATATADRPTMWRIGKSVTPDLVAGTEEAVYTLRFTTEVDVGARNVKAEPA